jgi:hypothetical protein
VSGPQQTFLALPLGTRVVIRYRIEGGASGGGATDVLGELTRMSATQCEVRTRSGDLVTVVLADIFAAKAVPPPPASRRGRRVGWRLDAND